MSERIPTLKLTMTEWTNLVMSVVQSLGEERVKDILRRALGVEAADLLIEKKSGPKLTKEDNRRIIRELYNDPLTGPTRDAKIAWAMQIGRRAFESDERFSEVLKFVNARVAEDEAAGGTIDNPPPKPEPAPVVWRRDLATIQAVNESVEFYTRNLSRPSGGGHNADGGMEWIIARITGSGFERLLLMVMGGDRPPQRIYFDGEFTNSGFKIPMIEEAHWKVESRNGTLTVYLNGNAIWSKSGGFRVGAAVMNGYPRRHSTGEWRV